MELEVNTFHNAVAGAFNSSPSLRSLHDPFIPDKLPSLEETIRTSMVSTYGNQSALMAENLRLYTKANWCDVTSSGTLAIVTALNTVGVKNKLVITSNLSFYASANAILLAGGIPYFVDIELQSLGLDVNRLSELLKKIAFLENGKLRDRESKLEIAAILVPHLFGFLSEIESIQKVADLYQLPVIEDAAEALGVKSLNGKSAGSLSDIGIFSFNGNKIITAGGGGAICGNSETHFKHVEGYLRGGRTGLSEEPTLVGTNGRMPAINAAFLLDQYVHFDKILNSKRKIHEIYKAVVSESDYSFHLKAPNVPQSNYWLNILEFVSQEELIAFQNISDGKMGTRRLWRPFSEIDLYKKFKTFGVEKAAYASSHLLTIASSPNLVI
jgi:dTDP-4-amino-4,6-dideoxygalactose transaminase